MLLGRGSPILFSTFLAMEKVQNNTITYRSLMYGCPKRILSLTDPTKSHGSCEA